ncbi:MAG: DUF2007 domain-containing protein [Blastocatellia bacterium]|nr:DUF2007 domain-containing protein [Blastocatellia bacterium]
MPFCPKCLSEYKREITHCNECDLDLVEELTDENRIHDISDAPMVELRRFSTATEAQMIRGLLEQNDIRALIQGETSSSGLFPAATSVVLLVDGRDFSKAKELAEAYLIAEIVMDEKILVSLKKRKRRNC